MAHDPPAPTPPTEWHGVPAVRRAAAAWLRPEIKSTSCTLSWTGPAKGGLALPPPCSRARRPATVPGLRRAGRQRRLGRPDDEPADLLHLLRGRRAPLQEGHHEQGR